MKELSLRELQLKQLDLLLYLTDFLDSHGLMYYLHYGSLIGALRHGGFIPWDDDIDVAMPRADYEKLIALYPEFNNHNIRLRHFKTDSKYFYPFIKVQDNYTSTTQKCSAIPNMGVNIDILPIDNIPINYYEREGFLRGRYQSYTNWRSVNEWDFYPPGWRKHFFFKRIINSFKSNYELCKRFDDYCSQYQENQGRMGIVLMVRSYMDSCVPNDHYGDGRFEEFEGHRFRIPNQAEVILDKVYGEWRSIPNDSKDHWSRSHKYYEID